MVARWSHNLKITSSNPGISSKFKGKVEIINQIENWQGTGEIFEYYRRDLDPEKIHQKKIS